MAPNPNYCIAAQNTIVICRFILFRENNCPRGQVFKFCIIQYFPNRTVALDRDLFYSVNEFSL